MHLKSPEFDASDHSFKSLMAELAENPQLLVSVLNAVYDRIYLKNADDQVIFANTAFLKAFKLSPEQVNGRHLRDFLPKEIVEPCETADQFVYENGEPTCLESRWVEPASGKVKFSETFKAPLLDSKGNVTGIIGFSRDITSRRRTEEELKRQKTLLELIVETVPDWIFVKDRERRIILANRAFYDQNGLDPVAAVGTDPTAELPEESRTISYESDTRVLKTGESISGDVNVTDPDGRERHVEFRKLPLIEDDQITGIVSVCRDLTEWKEAEEQSKRSESLLLHAARLSSLGEFSAGIAHEVNQPLYSILNYAKAIKNKLQADGDLDLEAISKWVDQIHSEAERGGEITRRLKAFVKPTESQRTPSDIDMTVSESIEFMRIEARDAGVVIEKDLETELPQLVFDRIQIQQVLVNLLKNAIEACVDAKTSDPQVVVTTKSHSEFVEVAVADNGPGLSAPAGVDILDPFQTTKHEGVGLGLAISKSIIEAHEGQITYASNESGGVTFKFSLPKETSHVETTDES